MDRVTAMDRLAAASLRGRLIALVLIPVLGMSVFSVFSVASRLHSLENAVSGRQLIEDAGAFDRIRVSLLQEIIPTQGLAVLSSPEERKRLRIEGVPMSLDFMRKNVDAARKETDTALAEAMRRSSLKADLATTALDIADARKDLMSTRDVDHGNDNARAIAASLAKLETSTVVKATQLGLDGLTAAALRDLELAMQATKSASLDCGIYMGGILSPTTESFLEFQRALQGEWAIYQSTVNSIMLLASGPVQDKWAAATRDETVSRFDTVMVKTLTLPTTQRGLPSLGEATGVLTMDVQRNRTLSGVLQFATDRATSSARAMEAHSRDLLWLSVMFSIGLDLLVFLALFYINRSVTRPLELVAIQAEKLSHGELATFPVGGPKEVRTVARGLDAAVGSLQRIQDSANAVADGDLESSSLRQPLPGRLGEVIHASMSRIVDAINAQEEAQKELAHRAAHDELTELPNRAEALITLEKALHRASRSGSAIALLFIDLDKFKQVNDTLGHQAGDRVLQIAAERMIDVVREGDTVARLGGDEFVVILENVEGEANFVQLAERLISSLSAPMMVLGHVVTIGASVGLAISRDGRTDAGVFLKEADAAVYEAKRSGRGRVDVFDEHLRDSLAARSALEHAIETALLEDEFELLYQPVVDLETGATQGVEALIRWNRPGVGLVMPDQFIPTAEMSSLINDIGRWTLRHATRQLREWNASPALTDLTMSVNISGRHLSSTELLSDVQDALEQSGIRPEQLILEITETVVLDDPRALFNMTEARNLGVKLALDDFGTGFTSIGQLARLPIDIVKIDRSFASSSDDTHQALVQLMVTAAHTFGLEVVAEGLETAAQVQALRRALADNAQGFFFARPAPAGQVLKEHQALGQI